MSEEPDTVQETCRKELSAGIEVLMKVIGDMRVELGQEDEQLTEALLDLDSVVNRIDGRLRKLNGEVRRLRNDLRELSHCHNALSARVDGMSK